MRTTMKVLAAVVLFTAACGDAPYSTDSSWDGRYRLAGRWQVWTDTQSPVAVGQIDLAADLSSGSYSEAGTAHAMTAHAFSSVSPDFSLTFGDRSFTGRLLASDNSNVFRGTLGTTPVIGSFVPH